MLDQFTQGGDTMRLLGAAGGLAALLALISVVLILVRSSSTPLRIAAISAMLLSDVTLVAGVVGSIQARQGVDAAASRAKGAKGERIKYEGYIDAGSTSAKALPMAGIPLLIAAVGLRIAGQRRWGEEHDSPPKGPLIPGLLFVIGVLTCGVAAFLWQMPRQGRKMDETCWRVLELRDAVNADDWGACLKSDLKIEPNSPAADMKELKDIQARCAKHYVTASQEVGAGTADLEKLLAAPWFEDKTAVRRRLDEMAASQKRVERIVNEKPQPPPDPAFGKVQVVATDCYRKAGKPSAAPASIQILVAKSGKILDAKPKESAKQTPAAKKCLAKGLKAVSFLQGEERTLDVPILLPRK